MERNCPSLLFTRTGYFSALTGALIDRNRLLDRQNRLIRSSAKRGLVRPTRVGFTPPSWLSVKSHKYVPWTEPRLTIDTAVISVIDAVSIIEEQIQAVSAGA
jgi:hypothetical protein